MGHTLVLEVPEEVYQPLAEIAKRTGATPETLAVEWLTAASRAAGRDPVEKFIGAFPSGISGWSDQHDKYLGQTLDRERE